MYMDSIDVTAIPVLKKNVNDNTKYIGNMYNIHAQKTSFTLHLPSMDILRSTFKI